MRVKGNLYQGQLSVGQRVHSILYGGMDGIIMKINGEQEPESIRSLGGGCVVMGGRATLDIVFEEYISKGIPESIVRGVQWDILDEIVPPDQILIAVCEADLATREKKAEEEKKERELKESKAGLPAKFPYLQTVNSGVKISDYALGAKNIRTELKIKFRNIKFNVTSKGYSGGCSINVTWTDGPAAPDVEKIIKKYQEGDFDGMEDLYTYDHSNGWPDVFGGAKYVFAQRDYSKEFVEMIAKAEGYPLKWDQYGRYDCVADTLQDAQSSRHWLNDKLHNTAF